MIKVNRSRGQHTIVHPRDQAGNAGRARPPAARLGMEVCRHPGASPHSPPPPSNVILIDIAAAFDGFSIGSNDLTQLTLGVGHDSEIVAFDFDERDPGLLEMLRLAVTSSNHRHVGI